MGYRCGIGPVPEDLKHLPRLSPTSLCEFRETPSSWKAYVEGKKEETPSMLEGKQIHRSVLESEKFLAEYTQAPQKELFPNALFTIADMEKFCTENSIATKSKWKKADYVDAIKAHCAANGTTVQIWDELVESITSGKIMLTDKVWNACIHIAKKVKERKFLGKIWEQAVKEQYMWYLLKDDEDPEDQGVIISFVADIYALDVGKNKRNVAGDLKVVRSAHPKDFESTIFRENFFIKAAMYLDGLSIVLSKNFDTFFWIAATKTSPYIVQEYAADFGMIEAGRAEYKNLIKQWKKCWKENNWPDYSDDVLNISLPAWAWKGIQDEFASDDGE